MAVVFIDKYKDTNFIHIKQNLEIYLSEQGICDLAPVAILGRIAIRAHKKLL
jgi:hypothetical protein